MPSYFYNDAEAPAAKRIHAGAVIAIFHDDRVLMDLRADGGWGLVGGALEIGESLTDCVKREALEEAGIVVEDLKLLGVFSDPTRVLTRAGEALQLLTTCFASAVSHEQLRISAESQELKYCSKTELSSLEIVPTHRIIIPYLFREDQWPILL